MSMENFENSLDLSILDDLPKEEAINYIIAKYWKEIANEVMKFLDINNK